jgi:Ca-activated chloride channel family protein
MALFFKRLFKRQIVSDASVNNGIVAKTYHKPARCNARAYILVVDESGSTGSPMSMGSRRTLTRMQAIQLAAKDYVRQLLATNPSQLVGLVGFSDMATLHHLPTPIGTSFQRFCNAVQSLRPRSTTNLSAGLSLALGQLAKVKAAHSNIVVITDGAANADTSLLPQLIRQAKADGARIFTIGVGNNGDSDYNRKLLIQMARSTGGRFSSAHSFEMLVNALLKAS